MFEPVIQKISVGKDHLDPQISYWRSCYSSRSWRSRWTILPSFSPLTLDQTYHKLSHMSKPKNIIWCIKRHVLCDVLLFPALLCHLGDLWGREGLGSLGYLQSPGCLEDLLVLAGLVRPKEAQQKNVGISKTSSKVNYFTVFNYSVHLLLSNNCF